VPNVVTMSASPGSDPGARYPSWVVNPWDGVYLDVLDYQRDVAAEFWTGIDALARARGEDAVITAGVAIRGVLGTSFERVPADAEGKVRCCLTFPSARVPDWGRSHITPAGGPA
jgi:hypothetical protein